ncbi:diguanylate cyclase domain-containing protein [uncultured Cellulomonas sp.]|uniref:diguanylate cyclase domain-containing protein n=1 Tax=uncultured Cellulomonas sp. TaxID=189682 RepID=UPI0026150731|nr:diguanylate cyclase [uncultured Cellulomonas sp.]
MREVDTETAELIARCVQAGDTPMVVSEASGDFPIIYVNPAFEALTGYAGADVLGRNCRFLQGPQTHPGTVRSVGDDLRAGRGSRARLVNLRADGSSYWAEIRISAVADGARSPAWFLAVVHDVSEEVAHLQEAARAASQDPLTGLMNRVAFAAATERELVRATRHHRSVGVLFLDLDGFKQVNDTHGHPVGDRYLVHVAEVLRRRLRTGDMSARHGGDEFTVLLTDLPADGDAAAHVVASLTDALAEPFTVDGAEHRVAVTIGAAVFPRDGGTVRELVAHADADMYGRKPWRPDRPDRPVLPAAPGTPTAPGAG